MPDWLQSFTYTFIPLFIVIDALGNLPFVVTLNENREKKEWHRIIHISVITAALVGMAFLFFGQFILKAMGISVAAFAIAGGIILLVLSIRYMTTGKLVEAVKEEMVAIVPVGTPLTVGPATITTLLLLVDQFPLYTVLISFILNIVVTWLIFMSGGQIVRFLGRGGSRALSQVFNLILAAIGVTMVIRGMSLLGILSIHS